MTISEYASFVVENMPSHAEEISTALDLLVSSLDNTKAVIDGEVSKLLSKDCYDEVGQYISVSKGISEIEKKCKEVLDSMIFDNASTEVIIEDTEDEASDRINYEEYRVDDSIAYNLYSDFTYKKPAAFVFMGKKYQVAKWKQMFTKTCEVLCERNSKLFYSFVGDESLNGRKRIYFSSEQKDLRDPRLVPKTNVYIETNMSANQIRNTIIKMLEKYDISRSTFQVYLCKDFTELHKG